MAYPQRRKLCILIVLMSCILCLYFGFLGHSFKAGQIQKQWKQLKGNIPSSNFIQGSLKQPKTMNCHRYAQFCWVRDIISTKFDQALTDDIFDMSMLYKFNSHLFLDYPQFHIPNGYVKRAGFKLVAKGREILEKIQYEQRLTGNHYSLLNLSKGIDIDGRNCSYTPYSEYKYGYKAYYNSGEVQIYVSENTLFGNRNLKHRMNDLFGTVKTSSTISICRLTTYFNNNTYLFICPIREHYFLIEINATYISITDSDFTCKWNRVWNLKKYGPSDFSNYKSGSQESDQLNTSVQNLCRNQQNHETGFWLKISPYFHWATESCHYPFSFSDTTVQCLRSKKVILFGDSHGQNRKDALQAAYGLKNVKYYWTLHCIHLVCHLLDVYSEFLKGQRPADILVANAGAHDFRGLDIITYIATMSDVFKLFKMFLSLDNPPKIIWIETMPTHRNGFHGRFMTNQFIAGINEWVNYNMYKHGIEVVHAYDIVIPMTSQHRGDGQHYFHFLGSRYKNHQKVNTGGAVTSVLSHIICPNH